MSVRVLSTDLHVLDMRTRMPFRYGIATLTALPHLFVRVEAEIAGKRQFGIAADGLPPKWFTKDPDTLFKDDLVDMLAVIHLACDLAVATPESTSVFEWWRTVYLAQQSQCAGSTYPSLLWNFGVTLVERAMIDAYCRATGQTFHGAVHNNMLGINLGSIHPELAGARSSDFLPAQPRESIIVRHTVGLGDPLTDADIPADQQIDDGLPQSLEASIRAYGLTHFKIKLAGKIDADLDRLRNIARLLRDRPAKFTLDGNENYRALEPFQQLWEKLVADRALSDFLTRGLIFVEQPLHRDVAMSDDSSRALLAWKNRPPMIIDESDATFDSLPRALNSGYIGTSHKNCKGIFKGIASACLIAHRKRTTPHLMISGEDLANVGPVALLEDLAVLATLGIEHAERNGHHYFKGLSAFPADVQEQMLSRHSDLYERHPTGFATLSIRDGALNLQSVNAAPLGTNFDFNPKQFTPI